jgi:hypothetical protein
MQGKNHDQTRNPVNLSLCIAVMLCSTITGCSTFGAHQAFTYRKTQSNDPNKVLTYAYDPSLATPDRPFFKYAYRDAGTNKRRVRNTILYELMGMVDDYYYQYTSELRRDVSGKGILVDTAGLATSIASTAAGANELKTVLSAASSSVQGLSKSIDANVLMGNTVQAIRLQMDGARADIATDMITKMKQQDCDEYPLEAGLRDVIRYYDAGTLTSGVAALSKEAGVKKSESENAQKRAEVGTFTSDDAEATLRNYWKPNGVLNKDHAAAFNGWLQEHENGVDIATFLYSSKYSSERPKAVAALIK